MGKIKATFEGFNNLLNSTKKFKRLILLILIIGFFAYIIFVGQKCTTNYFNYETDPPKTKHFK